MCRLDIRKDFCETAVMHWHGLHRALVGSPPQEVLRNHRDMAQRDMVSAHTVLVGWTR